MSFEYKCTIYQKDDNILQPVVLFIKYIELIAKYTYTYHVLPNIFQWVQDSTKKTYFARTWIQHSWFLGTGKLAQDLTFYNKLNWTILLNFQFELGRRELCQIQLK